MTTDMQRKAFEGLLSEWRVLERINGNKHSRHSIKFCADQLESVLKSTQPEITELRAKTAMTMGVGTGNGKLFVHGDYDSIKAAQDIVLAREKLRAIVARLREPVSDEAVGDFCITYESSAVDDDGSDLQLQAWMDEPALESEYVRTALTAHNKRILGETE